MKSKPLQRYLSLLVCFLSLSLSATMINGTAAVVGKTLITVQDAYLYRSLLRFKEGESPAILSDDLEQLKKTVQKLIFEEMVYSELKSFQFDAVTRADADKLIQQKRIKHANDWKAIQNHFQISEKDLTDRVFRMLQVERFLQKRVDTLTPVITDSEALSYYKQNESKFKGNNFEEFKPNIVLLLKKQKMQKGLEDWIKFLKEKYTVVNHLDTL